MQKLIDTIPMCVFICRYVNGEYIFVALNKKMQVSEKIVGHDLIGSSVAKLFRDLNGSGLYDLLKSVQKSAKEQKQTLSCIGEVCVECLCEYNVNKLENGDIIVVYGDKQFDKELEKKVRIQKKQLEDAQQIAHLGSWIWDIKSGDLHWSDEVFRIFCEEVQSFTPTYERFLSYLNEEDRVTLEEVINESLQNNTLYSFEHMVYCSSGTTKYVLESGSVEYGSNGEAISMTGTILDITERKRVQRQLESFRSIVDNSINEIYIFDASTYFFTYINQSAHSNIGYTLEEMMIMTPADIKPEYNIHSFKLLMEPIVDGNQSSLVFETFHQRKDGTSYNVEIRIQAMIVDNREQFIVVANDITNRIQTQLKLKESEEQFRTIAESTLMGIFVYHEKYVYVNEAIIKMLGYTEEELYQIEPWKIVEESSRKTVKDIALRRLNGENFTKEYSDIVLVTKQGQKKIMRVSTQTIKYNDRYAGMGTIMDVTDIIETKKQLQLLAQAIEQMDELVRITDKNGIITYVNDALVAHSGYRQVELLGQNINIFKSGKHDKEFYKKLWDTILSGKTYRCVFINVKKDKTLYYEEETITPMMDNDGKILHFITTSQDITQRVALDEKLNKLATIDSLTGVYNRHHTNEEIDIEIARASRTFSSFALVMLDIDHFKSVNDTYGHDVGDYVLKELSKIVLNGIRESDRFGRWGGEEFMLILPDITKEGAIKFAKKIKNNISTHSFKGIDRLTVSIGVSIFTHGQTKESILKCADNALYKAKEDGRNCVRYYE